MIRRLLTLFGIIFTPVKKTGVLLKSSALPSKKLYRKYYRFSSVEDIPDEISEHVLYLVGDKDFKWLLIFRCPCGCRDVIQLNLLKEARPGWRVKFHNDGDVSVYPSVNRQINCKSHFNITRNSVRWWDWLDHSN